MRRALFCSLALTALFAGTAQAAALRDIAENPYRDSIQQLVDRGIVHGYADGSFKPNLPINRAEFLKILMLAVHGDAVFEVGSTACFFDFGPQVQWYYPHACTARSLGIVEGYPDGTFRGENTVNLVEALKMSLEAWGVPLPQYFRAPDHWYDPYVDAASTTGVFRTIPLVPDFPLTRGEAAELLVKLGQPLQALDPEFSDFEPAPVTVQQVEEAFRAGRELPGICGNGDLERGEECDDGNVLNDDGCSAICVVVPQPVRHGALRVEQRPLGGVALAKGARDVLLLSFDAIAGRQDIFLTQLKFAVDAGSLGSGRNYRLFYDRDGDGQAEKLLSSAVPQNERLSFTDLSIPVRDGFYTRVELYGDIASSGTVGSFSVQFDTAQPDYVEGVDAVDGEDVLGIVTDNASCTLVSICWVSVLTQASRLVSIGTQGSLFVTEDTSPVSSRQLLAGNLSDTLLALKFRAEQEDVEVTKISIGGGTNSIDSLELFEAGASSPFAVARKSSCTTVAAGQFCADTSLSIPRDSEKRISVKARVNADTAGGVSGDAVALTLTAATSGNVAVEAWGLSSDLELNQNNGNGTAEGEVIIGRSTAGANIAVSGETHDVVAAKFASIVNSHDDADESPVPAGASTIASFLFTALPHGNSVGGLNLIEFESITFKVTATNVEFDSGSFELFNPANQGVAVSCSGGTTGVITVVCSGLDSSAVHPVISQGGSVELSLRGDIVNPQVSAGTSTLQVQMNGLGNRAGGGPILWNDEASPWDWVESASSSVRSTLYRTQ